MKTFVITLIAFGVCATIGSAQSLWNAARPAPAIFTDTSARNVGDILTIVVDESQSVQSDEKSELTKESSLDAMLTNFDILPNFFEPFPAAAGTQKREFDGEAKYDKDGRLRTTISVIVMDRLPNGNLLVEGSRRILVDGETKTVRLTGLVRTYDVSRINTVSSTKVANAAIQYEGQGFMTRATNRGWFSRLLDIVWPF